MHDKFRARLGHAVQGLRRNAAAKPAAAAVPVTSQLRKRARRDEEGGALVEFALVLPMLLLIMTGIFSFGIALNTYLQLTEATSVGARNLAISRGQTLDPCAITATAVTASAPNLTASKFTFTYALNGTNFSGTSCSSSSTTTGAAGDLVEGKNATVTVTYPCNLSVYGHNYAPGCTLQASTTELVQ